MRQDEFTIWLGRRKCQRHVFLFEDLILFSKPKRIEGGFDVYIYKRSFKVRQPCGSLLCGKCPWLLSPVALKGGAAEPSAETLLPPLQSLLQGFPEGNASPTSAWAPSVL